MLEVQQPHGVAAQRAVGARVLHGHAIHQQAVEAVVLVDDAGHIRVQRTPQRLLAHLRRHGGVEPRERRPQPADQHHIGVALPLRPRIVGVRCETVRHGVAELAEPFQGGLLDRGFIDTGMHDRTCVFRR